MAKSALTPATTEAIDTLASSIRAARIRRGWTVRQLAERIGVSHATVTAIEAGKPSVAIGTVFEAATLVGVPLFSTSESERRTHRALKRAELALLPATVRERPVDDEF